MNIKHYEDFLEFQRKGLKKNAAESINKFIASFSDKNDVAQWVWNYISEVAMNPQIKIRYEIFEQLLFPVLMEGYENRDFQSTLWLGKLIALLEQARHLHKKIDFKSDFLLYMECYNREPENQEVLKLLLQHLTQWFEYCQHEWPRGILYRNDGATKEECKEIRQKLVLARELDRTNEYAEFLTQFEKKLNHYESRLKD